jgi:hypothetical protein
MVTVTLPAVSRSKTINVPVSAVFAAAWKNSKSRAQWLKEPAHEGLLGRKTRCLESSARKLTTATVIESRIFA